MRGPNLEKWNSRTIPSAAGLHRNLVGFEFVITSKIVGKTIGFTRKRTVLL